MNSVEKLEVEHKYLVRNFSPKMLEPQFPSLYYIEQDYLINPDPECSERVRVATRLDTKPYTIYTHTIKRPAVVEGRIEIEEQISEEQYRQLLKRKDYDYEKILKYRYYFTFLNQIFELDHFAHPFCFAMVEAEVRSLQDPITLPPFLEMVEVTELKEFSNKRIAWNSDKTQKAICAIREKNNWDELYQ